MVRKETQAVDRCLLLYTSDSTILTEKVQELLTPTIPIGKAQDLLILKDGESQRAFK